MPKLKKQKITFIGEGRERVMKVEYPSIKKSLSVPYFPELADDFEEHGRKQRYGDLESGKSPAEKYAAAVKLLAANTAGSWEIEIERDTSAIVIEAATRLMGKVLSEVIAALEEKSEEDREAKIAEWRGDPRIKAEIAQIRAERAKAAADESDDDDEISVD